MKEKKMMCSIKETGKSIRNDMNSINKMLKDTRELLPELTSGINGLKEENKKLLSLVIQQHSIILDIIAIYGEEELKEKLKAHSNKNMIKKIMINHCQEQLWIKKYAIVL